MKKYISIDIGGTAIKHSVIEEDGKIIYTNQIDTEAKKGGRVILDKAKDIIKSYVSDYKIDGVCVSTAGMVDPKEGKIIYASSLIPNYTGVEIKKEIEKEFNIPCEVENDVNCAALGEYWLGAAKNSHSCACLTIGTGIGGCIIIGGKVIHGFSNSAGEVGYMKINGSTFQELAATSKLVEKVARRKKINKEELNGKIIFNLAREGDIDCIEEIDNLVDTLALGISYIVYLINPEVVVLGGGIMAQREYLEERINTALKDKLIDKVYKSVKIKFAQNQNNAGMLGALYNFKSKK